jgi:hypothetical protein
VRARLFLLVDPRSARALLRPLHDHFRPDPRVAVLVERRAERAQHQRPAAHRRAPVAERDAARALPAALRHAARDLRLVLPLPPLRRTHEASELGTLVEGAVAMDPEAIAELWWRVAPRALGRLALRVGDAAAAAAMPTLLGCLLDDLAAGPPARDGLAPWLDAAVDRYGAGPTIVQPLVRSSSPAPEVCDRAAHWWGTAMERMP